MKFTKILLLIVFVFLVLLQFTRPDKNESGAIAYQDFITETKPPEEVNNILVSSCFNCHSNHTIYPWYNAITPINYLLDNNIIEGKKQLNFSKWNDYSNSKKDDKLAEMIEVVETKEMPLTSYTWMHSEADLSHEQIQEIVNWAKLLRFQYSLKPKPQ